MDQPLPSYVNMHTLQTIHFQVNLNGTRMMSAIKSIKVAGSLQPILTNDGYVITTSIRGGLPYVVLQLFTDEG